ncbi:MAG: hypothetical protein AVDCRST_MAG80-2004, partial [uncultured Rubrobacteraceae bacterium]
WWRVRSRSSTPTASTTMALSCSGGAILQA